MNLVEFTQSPFNYIIVINSTWFKIFVSVVNVHWFIKIYIYKKKTKKNVEKVRGIFKRYWIEENMITTDWAHRTTSSTSMFCKFHNYRDKLSSCIMQRNWQSGNSLRLHDYLKRTSLRVHIFLQISGVFGRFHKIKYMQNFF